MSEEVKQSTEQVEGDAPKPDPAFTQADIDRIVKERIERVKTKYADYDDLKSKSAKLDELERAKTDEQERLAADLTALEDLTTAMERGRELATMG